MAAAEQINMEDEDMECSSEDGVPSYAEMKSEIAPYLKDLEPSRQTDSLVKAFKSLTKYFESKKLRQDSKRIFSDAPKENGRVQLSGIIEPLQKHFLSLSKTLKIPKDYPDLQSFDVNDLEMATEQFDWLDDERSLGKSEFQSLMKLCGGMVYFSPLLEVLVDLTCGDEDDEEELEDAET